MRFLYLLLFSLFIGCSLNKDATVDRIYIKNLSVSQGARVVATGAFNYVEGNYYHFQVTKSLNLDDARKFVLDCINLYVRVTSNLKYKDVNHLNIKKRLKLTIGFKDADDHTVDAPYIALVYFFNGKIAYDTYLKSKDSYREMKRETYEEAIKIRRIQEEKL